MNQQIGFYRNMAFASALAGVIIAGESVHGSSLVPAVPWVPFFGLTTWMFIYRYRRFWRYFGDNVIRGFRGLLQPRKPDGSELAANAVHKTPPVEPTSA